METTTSCSTDGLRIELPNNGSSNQFQRPLDLRTGRTTAWKFHQAVEPTNLESQAQSLQDGGNFSSMMVPSSST
jgi:hypothetical protein